MLEGNLRLIDHRDRFLEAGAQWFGQKLLAQNALQQQIRDPVAIPLIEGNLPIAVPISEGGDERTHRLLNIATKAEADHDFELLVAGRNPVGDIVVQHFF